MFTHDLIVCCVDTAPLYIEDSCSPAAHLDSIILSIFNQRSQRCQVSAMKAEVMKWMT